ncbi:ABC transporter permease, partial [candidate division KSB1 bacterium]
MINKKSHRPPKTAERIISLFAQYHNRPYILGDLEEDFLRKFFTNGLTYARIWYWLMCLKILPGFLKYSLLWSFVMLKNYLKITLRNVKKHKTYSMINIFGLAFGLACCILILFWVNDELSYDSFHDNVDRIFRVVSERKTNRTYISPVTPGSLAPALKQDFPEVENSARLMSIRMSFRYGNNFEQLYQDRGLFADPSFFDMFSFPIVQGDASTALSDPFSVVISKRMASVIFGEEDPIGKILIFDDEQECTVRGVMENVPKNSHLTFEYVLPVQYLKSTGDEIEGWDAFTFRTYVSLKEDILQKTFNQKITGLIESHDADTDAKPILQKVTDIHLHALDGGGLIIYVYIISTIGFFILVIACINYMNLSTARSGTRALEVGLRKAVGASRSNIVKQFFGESILQTFIALIFALIFVVLFLPLFNDLSGKQITFHYLLNPSILIGLVGLALFTGIVPGSYPAVYLSSFLPVNVFKGGGGKRQGSNFRRILVVIQFALSVTLIIG